MSDAFEERCRLFSINITQTKKNYCNFYFRKQKENKCFLFRKKKIVYPLFMHLQEGGTPWLGSVQENVVEHWCKDFLTTSQHISALETWGKFIIGPASQIVFGKTIPHFSRNIKRILKFMTMKYSRFIKHLITVGMMFSSLV